LVPPPFTSFLALLLPPPPPPPPKGEVVLYPGRDKPREGTGLNRPATVTLFQCFPPEVGQFPDAESKARYRGRIAQMTEEKGAHFVDYDCDTGTWRFQVDHF
ncbi:unnamed protein product, partial [Prorocentrum cordatum]